MARTKPYSMVVTNAKQGMHSGMATTKVLTMRSVDLNSLVRQWHRMDRVGPEDVNGVPGMPVTPRVMVVHDSSGCFPSAKHFKVFVVAGVASRMRRNRVVARALVLRWREPLREMPGAQVKRLRSCPLQLPLPRQRLSHVLK